MLKRFIFNLLGFGCVILLVSFIIECSLLFKINRYSYKKEYVEEHINEIECLLLGNSHIEEALRPEIMGNHVFNLAISGKQLVYDIELAKRYVPRMNQLKVVVIPLDYASFYFGREQINNIGVQAPNPNGLQSSVKCMYYKYMDIRVDGFWYWSEILNSKLNYMSKFWMTYDEARECDSLGYIPKYLNERTSDWKYRALPYIIDESKPINIEEYHTLYSYYTILSELTYKKNVRLVLLGTPMYKTYQDYMSKTINKEIERFVSKLQNEYSNVEYYNYSYDKRFVEDDFSNSSHLNDIGAVKFSKILKDEIMR